MGWVSASIEGHFGEEVRSLVGVGQGVGLRDSGGDCAEGGKSKGGTHSGSVKEEVERMNRLIESKSNECLEFERENDSPSVVKKMPVEVMDE